MRYLVFSDSHLTDRFEPKKSRVLNDALKDADRVIINGDFWEGFSTTFDAFINSPWKDHLFPILKKKKSIYIFGNHDKKDYADERMNLFSDKQVTHFDLKSGSEEFHFEHGNRLIKLLDEQLHKRMPPFLNNMYERYEGIMVRTFGRHYLRTVYGSLNKIAIKKYLAEVAQKNYLVMGHTHYAQHDKDAKFINSGFIKHGLAQYIYIEDGNITQVEKRY